MKRQLIFLTSFFFGLGAMSLQAQGNIWSLKRCLEHAQENNIQLKQASLNVESGEVNLARAKARRLPNLNGSINAFSRLGYFVDPFTNQLDQQTSYTFDGGLRSGVDLFTGFQITNSIKQSQIDLQANKANVEQQEYDLALDITLAYLQILQNGEFLESTSVQLTSTKEQYDRTQKLVKAGSLPPADLLQLESQMASEELNIVNAQNQLELAYLSLQQFLNLDPEASFGIQKLELDDPEGGFMTENTTEIYAFAESNQPMIRGAELNIQSAELEEAIAKGALLPSLSFSAGMGTGFSTGRKRPTGENISAFDQVQESINGSLALSLNLPIYNRRQNISNIELAEIGTRNAQYSAQLQRQNLKQIIEQAYLDAKSSYSSYQATLRQLKAAQLNFENVEKQFNVGISNSVDYLVAKNAANMANFDLLRNKYIYIFRTKVLDFYLGKPIGF